VSLFQLEAVAPPPVGAEDGGEAGGVVIVQHQAQKAVAQVLLAGPGEIITR